MSPRLISLAGATHAHVAAARIPFKCSIIADLPASFGPTAATLPFAQITDEVPREVTLPLDLVSAAAARH